MGRVVFTRDGFSVVAPTNVEIVYLKSIKAKPHIKVGSKEYKHCIKCDSWRQVSNFYISKQRLDGLQPYCRQCSEASAIKSNMKKFKR